MSEFYSGKQDRSEYPASSSNQLHLKAACAPHHYLGHPGRRRRSRRHRRIIPSGHRIRSLGRACNRGRHFGLHCRPGYRNRYPLLDVLRMDVRMYVCE